MARLNKNNLSIVIPSLNEASNLPLLLSDLQLWPYDLEISVCDCNSKDLTVLIAKLFGAKPFKNLEANRGEQLHHGADHSTREWILFLHADSRLPTNWPETVLPITNNPHSANSVWYFDLKIEDRRLDFRILELAVFIRSRLQRLPYGDQGLLIKRSLYKKMGGFKPLPIMEDLDLILRLDKIAQIKPLNLDIVSSPRRWSSINVFSRAIKNLKLRNRWLKGERSINLSKDYYQES